MLVYILVCNPANLRQLSKITTMKLKSTQIQAKQKDQTDEKNTGSKYVVSSR